MKMTLVRRKIACSIFPEHLRHFKEGGLSEKTIALAGFRSTPVSEVETALKLSLNGVNSTYRVPYPNFDGYLRYRVFPAYASPGGKKRKYVQAVDSSPHLYFHPLFPKEAFTNPSTPIYLIEGEKKVLALGQQG